MNPTFNERIDGMTRSGRSALYYFVGVFASVTGWLIGTRSGEPNVGLLILLPTAVFLAMRLFREIRIVRASRLPEA